MSRQKNLKRNLLICLLAGSAVMYTLPLHAATSVVANNALPQGGQFFNGNEFVAGSVIDNKQQFTGIDGNVIGSIAKPNDLTMNVHQANQNAVIKWGSFDVGGSATVNFTSNASNFNTLNYVNSGSASQIYGTINGLGGNIYVVNTAGVQIGPSAQINVGSLYVSNKNLDNVNWEAINNVNPDINSIMGQGATGDAALMSLGNINATNVTFEGNGRIVIDSERIKNDANNATFRVNTNDAGNVVIGYDAYNEVIYNEDGTIKKDKGTYDGKDKNFTGNVFVNGTNPSEAVKGYMWVEDVEQLQAINTNLGGNYALRNSIDATSTAQGTGFNPIGLDDNGKVVVHDGNKYGFTGKFDGIDYNIFGLNINRPGEINVGLFGVAHDANINNVTLVGGSITGGSVVGSVVGAALGNTHITNATNSASVTGNTDVGGIVGYSGDELDNVGDSGSDITGIDTNSHFTNLVNTGTVHSKGESDGNRGIVSNAGGLIGYMYNGKLDGNSYNLGDVSGKGYNVGGLVGHAENSTIGNEGEDAQLVYNRLDVEGAYNVGGIVGNMEGTTVQNAENSGNVTATGHTTGEYTYHTGETVLNNIPNGTLNGDGTVTTSVNVANVGGIAGTASNNSTIENVTNTADISSNSSTYWQNNKKNIYYTAGNVGGIVGRAENTDINNATNKENTIRGAHNVGGVAGYFGGSATITGGINDGGDIMATGARNANGFVKETVRPVGDANESFIIGNIGGVVGYLEGDNVYVTGSANRGTVHTDEPADPADVKEWQKAANVGGVVGKIDRNKQNTLNEIKNGNETAAVTNSYNTGDVLGYTGVGGVIGMMYNGAVSGSYNLGTVNTTRQVDRSGGSNIDPLNMGGIVGDTTEETNASAIIYDVYNKGQIGDEEFNYYARHVGGIVGRLSGDVEKAYNTGDIYNNDTVVGGIAGWWYSGTINNAFNTGNITAITATELQVGGLVGAAGANATSLTNAYNLGTIRGYQQANNQEIYLGGIVGKAANLRIDNVYTLGNLYAGRGLYTYTKENNGVGYIYGGNSTATVSKAYYITAEDSEFSSAAETGAEKINFANRYDKDFYKEFGFNREGYEGSDQNKGYVSADGVWRIYDDGTTPILNAFLPNTEKYFGNTTQNPDAMNNITSIQYGTAYDPLLTIINAKDNLIFDWDKLGIGGAGSLVVYGGGLTLDNVSTSNASGGSSYYGGVLYSDGALTIKGNENENLGFGSASELYGSEVTIKADGTVTIYGDVTATGNAKDAGNVTINAGDVNVYGTLTSATAGNNVAISGIASQANGKLNYTGVDNPEATMPHIGDRFTYTTQNSTVDGNIIINAGTKLNDEDETVTIGSGNVNLYYGNKEEGLITAGGNLDVTGTGNVYVDSDLDIGGDLTLTGNGENSEVVLDLTNIGQVQAKNGTVTDAVTGLHGFMHHFIDTNANINLKAEKSKDTKITVDMWDGNGFNLKKFDSTDHDFKQELDSMNVTINDNKLDGSEDNHVKNYTYIWVSDGDQLQAINNNGVDGLSYNYALKNDINASDVENYVAIGTGSKFTGTFDGRGNRIIGLTVDKVNGQSTANAGIFSTIGEGGTVKNVNIYSGNFTGTTSAGAVAGMNSGRIENVTGFGNTVTITNENGNAGGIVGVNNGNKGNIITNEDGTITLEPAENEQFATGIIDVESIGSVIAKGDNAVAGGLVGINDGALGNSYSDSAVTSTDGTSNGLGGVVGVNKGYVQYVDSLGVTNGGTNSDKVGGIIGVNKGNMYSGYNESIVSGKDNVGGIIGVNTSTVSNIVNATGINGNDYVGGLVGDNDGNVSSGRNNGTITGNDYVGGMVGSNGAGSILENLVNAESADIVGEDYVGGIAGTNSGEITADAQSTLENLGSITGQNYVGGVAGENIGRIEYIETNISLNVKDSNQNAQYFGGVAGINGRVDDNPNDGVDNDKTGTITSATNEGNVIAADADYVGGIVGLNTANGQLLNSSNAGRVEGANYVGGVAGKNEASITGEANDLVTIDNSGVVIAHEGGAGGIFGENTGKIEYAELTNNGIVSGTYNADKVAGTGGLIGVNSGEIKHSSLKNNIGGQVIGTQNVGGLIGVNTGKIEGGRDEANSYYKYQIYNNGVINVGTWEDDVDSSTEGYGKVEANKFTAQAGINIGGLIGYNTTKTINGVEQTGSLTAGYNTGAINAENSTNVGGIVGNNKGIVDQVFNTVYNTDGTKGAVTGGTNVGGLVGTNSGTLSNAYNTTAVEGSSNFGNAVGNNTTGTITNIYASNTSGKLIGNNINTAQDAIQNAYSFVKDDTSATTVLDEKVAQKAEESYGFDNKDDGTTWKFYNGYSNPLLKVFLTKAEYTGNKDFTYNATDQGLTINSNTITAADKLDAYNNANSLLTATQNKNAGEDYLGIYSQQIAASGKGDAFDPNNLGYDIDATYDIKQAQLNITLDNVYREYGNVAIIEGGYQIGNIDGWQGSDEYLANGITISPANDKNSFEQTDTALTGSSTGKVTENAGGQYTWSADVTLSEEIAQNYKITTTTLTGNSYVEKADLTISIGNAETVYGDAFTNADYSHTLSGITNGDNAVEIDKLLGGNYVNEVSVEAGRDTANAGIYTDMLGYEDYNELQNYNIKVEKGDITVTKADLTISVGNAETVYGNAFTNGDYSHTLSGITNGDKADDIDALLGGNYVNGVSVETGKATANAGTYEDKLNFANYNELNNYNIKVEQGDVVVTKADLNIEADNITSAVGNVPKYTGTDIQQGLVNGDTISDTIYNYGVSVGTDVNVEGNYTVGIYVDGNYYELSNPDWSTVTGLDFLKNYNVTFTTGTLTVTEQVMPDLPDNWPNNRWDYLFGYNPFDRNENFRERKAEVNFVDGAMEI